MVKDADVLVDLVLLPPKCTQFLQPLDMKIFGSIKQSMQQFLKTEARHTVQARLKAFFEGKHRITSEKVATAFRTGLGVIVNNGHIEFDCARLDVLKSQLRYSCLQVMCEPNYALMRETADKMNREGIQRVRRSRQVARKSAARQPMASATQKRLLSQWKEVLVKTGDTVLEMQEAMVVKIDANDGKSDVEMANADDHLIDQAMLKQAIVIAGTTGGNHAGQGVAAASSSAVDRMSLSTYDDARHNVQNAVAAAAATKKPAGSIIIASVGQSGGAVLAASGRPVVYQAMMDRPRTNALTKTRSAAKRAATAAKEVQEAGHKARSRGRPKGTKNKAAVTPGERGRPRKSQRKS